MVGAYAEFIAQKAMTAPACGLPLVGPLPDALYDFQRDIVRWALLRGRAAIFADCGLGKTLMQLAWADQVPGRVVIFAPLAVAEQTVAEGARFGIAVTHARHQDVPAAKIVISNYEMLHHFDPAAFHGVVLDESSILKAYDGATRTAIIEAFGDAPFRLACTATPAPNDHMELGNHSEFLGVMTRAEMLATFFVHDGGETQQWRVKRHAVTDWWKWVASWAVMIRKPSDLGYDDTGFDLPALTYHEHRIETQGGDGELFPSEAITLQERIGARRRSIGERVAAMSALVNASSEPWIVWCDLNDEQAMLAKAIPGALSVQGSDTIDDKVSRLTGFAEGSSRVLITKPSIAGFGMNWQHCRNVGFVGLTDSYEAFYQAVRRCWRFGQTQPVNVHIVTTDTMGRVRANIEKKDAAADRMAKGMIAHMHDLNARALRDGATSKRTDTHMDEHTITGNSFTVTLGDCVDVVARMPDASIDYTIFSPPFASLYTYSASDRDMGNVKSHAEFYEHFSFLIPHLFRVTKPGRLVSFHCMNLPTSKVRDGVIGLRDFRGELIRLFEAHGWVFHSEVTIWKDPVTAMQRTKAIGLLYKQLKKDSALSRQGIPDYLVTMRHPGVNAAPITKTPDDFPVGLWQNYASPVWMDIDPSDTLQHRSARDEADERHICPLQLEVIRRAVRLWSNPDDVVLSPFAGIGSEGVVALEMGRRFQGVELKQSYFNQCAANLEAAKKAPQSLFDLVDVA